MTHELPEKPQVLAIAGRTGLARFDVVGRLFTVWRWIDNNTVDSNARGVTSVTLNERRSGIPRRPAPLSRCALWAEGRKPRPACTSSNTNSENAKVRA